MKETEIGANQKQMSKKEENTWEKIFHKPSKPLVYCTHAPAMRSITTIYKSTHVPGLHTRTFLFTRHC